MENGTGTKTCRTGDRRAAGSGERSGLNLSLGHEQVQ